MLVPTIIAAFFTIAFLAKGGILAGGGRAEEARTYLFMGLAIGISATTFALVPAGWRRPALLVGEGALAFAEAALLVTWPRRRLRAGETKGVVDSSSGKVFGFLALGACLSLLSDVLRAGGGLEVLLASTVAALSLALVVLQRTVGVQITANGVLEGTQFIPWAAITEVRRETDGLVLITRRRFAHWLGRGWKRIRGSDRELVDLEDQVRTLRRGSSRPVEPPPAYCT